jgi:hypothetical protein
MRGGAQLNPPGRRSRSPAVREFLDELPTADHEPGIHDVPQQARRFIAETWLECFAQEGQP